MIGTNLLSSAPQFSNPHSTFVLNVMEKGKLTSLSVKTAKELSAGNKVKSEASSAHTQKDNIPDDTDPYLQNDDLKLVVISGLQGSGKTTRAKKIKAQLERNNKIVQVIPPINFMAKGGYIDLHQPKNSLTGRSNVVDELQMAHEKMVKKKLDVVIIVYSLNSERARWVLGQKIQKLGFKRKNVIEYYANTDPYLALIMGVSALPNEYTVEKHLQSISKEDSCNPEEDTNILRFRIEKFAIDVNDEELTERLRKIRIEALEEYYLIYNAVKKARTNAAKRIMDLMEKQMLSNDDAFIMDKLQRSIIDSENNPVPSNTTKKFESAIASNQSILENGNYESDTE